jgi:electron transfer flavoprotein beta subunit
MPLKILTCVKQVPDKNSRFKVRDDGKDIDEKGLTLVLNEFDAYAIETALRLKEKHGGEVVVLSVGGDKIRDVIVRSLAFGADRALQLNDAGFEGSDPMATARILAAAIAKEPYDLILTGVMSDDMGYAQTGSMLAELLGIPHATIVMEALVDEAGKTVTVKRELEAGTLEECELPLPALLTIQAGITEVRYPTLPNIMKARKKEIRQLDAGALGLEAAKVGVAGRGVEMRSLYEEKKAEGSKGEKLTGTPAEAAKALVERLTKTAKVL